MKQMSLTAGNAFAKKRKTTRKQVFLSVTLPLFGVALNLGVTRPLCAGTA